MTVWHLFWANFRMIVRNYTGFFWGIVMPAGLYVVLSLLPLGVLAGNSGWSYFDYLLPGIIAFTILQSGLYTLVYWMVDMKARGAIKRLRATPLTKIDLIISLLLARSVVMLFMVGIITIIGIILFD